MVGTYDGLAFTVEEVGPPEPVVGDDHDSTPVCDDYDHDATETSLDRTMDDIDGVAVTFVSDPAGDWDGPYVVNVVALPGRAGEVRAAAEARWSGALCVIERDQHTSAELETILEEVLAAEDAPWGEITGGGTDPMRGIVAVEVLVADDASLGYAQDRWGDVVVLTGHFEPVD